MKSTIVFLLSVVMIPSGSCTKDPSKDPWLEPYRPPSNTNNPPPTASILIFSDTTLLPYNSVLTMDGSRSTDPRGLPLNYQWRQISGPAYGSARDTTTAIAEYTVQKEGAYVFELTVTNPDGAESRDTATRFARYDGGCSTDRSIINPTFRLLTESNDRYHNPAIFLSGSKLILAGGYIRDPNDPDQWEVIHTADVDVYDISSGTWSKTSLPLAGTLILASAYKNLTAFVINYLDQQSMAYRNKIGIFNTQTNGWTILEAPETRFFGAAAITGNALILAGGSYYPDNSLTSRVDIFHFQTGNWDAAILSSPRLGMGVINTGQKIYFGGGSSGNGSTANIDVYDVGGRSWSIGRLTDARGGIIGTSAGGHLLWAGGSDLTHTNQKIEFTDLHGNVTGYDCLSNAASFGSAESMAVNIDENTVCFLVGGSHIVIYEPATRKWKEGKINIPLTSIFAHGGRLYGVSSTYANSRSKFQIYEIQY